MKQVNIYTYSTAKSPKAAESRCEAVGYVIEYMTAKGSATASNILSVHGMTAHQTEMHVLKTALNRINTVCELHIYTESGCIAAGFEKWLAGWKESNWKTKKTSL